MVQKEKKKSRIEEVYTITLLVNFILSVAGETKSLGRFKLLSCINLGKKTLKGSSRAKLRENKFAPRRLL